MWPAVLLALVVWVTSALAQEQWCTNNAANCVCSEKLQHTSYTVPWYDGYAIQLLGTDPNDYQCQMLSGAGSVVAKYQPVYFDQRDITIGSDPAILALLPNRNSALMVRYLRPSYSNMGWGGGSSMSTFYLGHFYITLGSAKRLALRWYEYHSPDYELAEQGSNGCSNGKTTWFGEAGGMGPRAAMMTASGATPTSYMYAYTRANGWESSYADYWYAFHQGYAPRPGSAVNYNSMRGKWTRMEQIIRRPRAVDSATSGFDTSLYMTNVTDGGTTVEDIRLSSGCTGCQIVGGVNNQNFTWTTAFRNTFDIQDIHVENYRAAENAPNIGCAGWMAYAYVAVAKWDTDAGQMIGAASEIEGGGGQTWAGSMILTVVSLLLFLTSTLIFGAVAIVKNWRNHAANRTPPPPVGGGDLWGEPCGSRPVVPPPDRVEDSELAGVAGSGSRRSEDCH